MNCRICGNAEENIMYDVREMMLGLNEIFQYFQCSKCKCLQIKDIPDDLSKYYPEDYYSYSSSKTRVYRNLLKRFLVRLRDKYALFGTGIIGKLVYLRYPREHLRKLSLTPIKKYTRVIDVGCGSGSLLYSMRELGMKNLLGVDPFNSKDIEYENGLKIDKKEIHQVEGKWDIVMFNHSFEHIPNQAKILETVSRLLEQDGQCIIRIPTVSSYAWEHYGVNWVQLDAPRHLNLHSVESMTILANQAGLDLHKVVYDSTPFQFWGSEQILKDIPIRDKRSYAENQQTSIFSDEDISAFAERAKELNASKQGDQAIFYLKKA